MSAFVEFGNRLRKNYQHWRRWARRRDIEVYRIYDADVPQFPFAIDCYGERMHMQEYYQPQFAADENAHQIWQETARTTVAEACQLERQAIVLKARKRQKGLAQYEKTGAEGEDFIVHENGRRFWVNLERYLDTGLFIDHRNTRQEVGELCAGKRLLNLFCYTASFTVYAATAGAIASESVDLSNAYLAWAQRNFALNGIDLNKHQTMRADVWRYLAEARAQRKQFDVIVLDPPSFSNSKKMQGVLDIQADHTRLIEATMALLSDHGVLYFSNNLRKFRLDEALTQRYTIQNISQRSVPEDFRNRQIHRCYVIRR